MRFCVKKLLELKKSEEKNNIFWSIFYLCCLNSHSDNLQGFMAQETKDRGD